MKKIILFVVAIVFAAQLTKAQTEKGTQNLGVDLSFLHQDESGTQLDYMNTSTPENMKNTNFSVGPTYGYFIANNLDIGASLSYSWSSTDNGPNYSPSSDFQRNYSGEVFLRKYFMYGKFGLRVGPYIGYGKVTTSYTYTPVDNIGNQQYGTDTYNGGINLALVYYPAKHLGLAATLGNLNYSHFVEYGTQDHDKGNDFSLSLISSNVGITAFWVFGSI